MDFKAVRFSDWKIQITDTLRDIRKGKNLDSSHWTFTIKVWQYEKLSLCLADSVTLSMVLETLLVPIRCSKYSVRIQSKFSLHSDILLWHKIDVLIDIFFSILAA